MYEGIRRTADLTLLFAPYWNISNYRQCSGQGNVSTGVCSREGVEGCVWYRENILGEKSELGINQLVRCRTSTLFTTSVKM